VTRPYKLVSRENHPTRSVVTVGSAPTLAHIGPDTFTSSPVPARWRHRSRRWPRRRWRAEPARRCYVAAPTSPDVAVRLSRAGRARPAHPQRGSREIGLPVVTEIVDAHDIDVVAAHADMLQVGTRNMQNFGLLQAVGASGNRYCSSAASPPRMRNG